MKKHINQNQVYAEVYNVLLALGEKYISKIPQNIFNIISEQQDKEYKVIIDKKIPLENQNLSEETIALLAMLKMDYWCETEKEKKNLQLLLNLNEEKKSGQPLSIESKKTWINKLKNKINK